MTNRLPKVTRVVVEQRKTPVEVIVGALFHSFKIHKLDCTEAALCIGAAYAMLLNGAPDEQAKRELVEIFDEMMKKHLPPPVGGN
jgi:hypothetical protein